MAGWKIWLAYRISFMVMLKITRIQFKLTNPATAEIGAIGGTFVCGPLCGVLGGLAGFGIGAWGTNEFWNLYNESSDDGGSCPDGDSVADNLADKIGEIADKLGMTPKEVKDAIHKAKENMPRNGSRKNPDVWVDTSTGEVYPQTPNGGYGDPIGNIFD